MGIVQRGLVPYPKQGLKWEDLKQVTNLCLIPLPKIAVSWPR